MDIPDPAVYPPEIIGFAAVPETTIVELPAVTESTPVFDIVVPEMLIPVPAV